MDSIRIVFFVIGAIIFIVTRVAKANKNKANPPRKQARPNSAPQQPLPTSLEEMLKEFGQQSPSQKSPKPVSKSKPAPVVKQFEEGKDRRFSDERSREIYEESVKRAEGFDLKFEPDSNFSNNRTKFGEGAIRKDIHKKNPLIASLREDLKNPNSTKKAIILSEILNRKY